MKNIRIGSIGAGNFAIRRAEQFATIQGVGVTLAWSRSQASRERIGREMGTRTVEDWREVCESDQVDAVVVSTPHVSHFEQARQVLLNGKHVLVETPLCLHYREAQELADLAARGRLVIHHGMQPRYHPDYDQEIQNIRRAGTLVYAEKIFTFGGPGRPWYWDFALSGGAFSFMSWAATDFFQAFGDAVAVDGRHTRRGTLDVATIWLQFAGGGEAKVTCGTGQDMPGIEAGTVIGAEGIVQWTPGSAKRLFKEGATTAELPQPRETDTTHLECQAFIDEIRNQRKFRATLDLDLALLRAVSDAEAMAQR